MFCHFLFFSKMLAVLVLLNINDDEHQLREFRLEQFKLKRSLRDVNNAFEMGDENSRRHYRMYPEIAVELIELLTPNLPDHSRKKNCTSLLYIYTYYKYIYNYVTYIR